MKNKLVIAICTVLIISIAITGIILHRQRRKPTAIKIGILHSLSGSLALSERPVANATRMAIEEINAKGGLLGRPLEYVMIDGMSDENTFAQEAERLIKEKHVEVIFGCWTSACKKRVRDVVERERNLLFYPIQYEGLEESRNVIYTGGIANQQIIPGIVWSFYNLGKTFYLVGSDYIFPRSAHEIIKDVVSALGGSVLGEDFIPLGNTDVAGIVKTISEKKPAVIVNTINGDSYLALYKELRAKNITPEVIPSISVSIAEREFAEIPDLVAGDYAVWNYFQSIDRPENKEFIARYKKRYGKNQVTSDPIEAGYFGVYIWAEAVKTCQTTNPEVVRVTLPGTAYNAPGGVVSIDLHNQHTWKPVYIAKILKTGDCKIIWNSNKTIPPVTFLTQFRSIEEWNKFLNYWYIRWEQQWSYFPKY